MYKLKNIYGAIYNLDTSKFILQRFELNCNISIFINKEKLLIFYDKVNNQLIIFKINNGRKITSIKKEDMKYILRKIKNQILFIT